jgi:hypothetical protein
LTGAKLEKLFSIQKFPKFSLCEQRFLAKNAKNGGIGGNYGENGITKRLF